MAARHERRSKDEWRRWVEKWRASGLSGTKFARRHGLSEGALYRWGRVFEAEAPTEMSFEEVRVRHTSPSLVGEVGAIEIVTHSGLVVRVVGDVDADRLRIVLEVVGSC